MKAKSVRKKIELPANYPLMTHAHDEIVHYLFYNYLYLLTPGEQGAYSYIILSAKSIISPDAASYQYEKNDCLKRHPEIPNLLKEGNAAFYDGVKDRLLREHANEIIFNRCPKCGTLCRRPAACLCPNPKCNHTWYETRE